MRKGLTIFQRLFAGYVLVGLIAVLFPAILHYQFAVSAIEGDVKIQVLNSFNKAAAYFEEFYNEGIRDDFDLITTTPILDNFLMSDANEAYMTKPNVEKLFLHFTRQQSSRYLSLRFINAKGQEQIIAEGNRRLRQYSSITSHSLDERSQRVFALFDRLRKVRVGTILFEGPFRYGDKWTFLIGVPKVDPDGGLGGAVIAHGDLSAYFKYLSTIKYRGLPIISATSMDNKMTLYNGVADTVFRLKPQATESFELWHSVEQTLKMGSGDQAMFKLKMRIPRVIFAEEVHGVFSSSMSLAFLIMIVVGLSAFFISRDITRPIQRLVKTTKQISAGDRNTRAEVVSNDEIGQLSRSFNEMIDSLKRSEERLQYEAFHDVLTALPNRALLLDRLERLIERNRRHVEHIFAVLFVDLDRFKNVNDSMGHTKGDELLVAISHRLRRCLRSMDTIARLGGDEFIILMDEIRDVGDATHLAGRILKELEPAFSIDGQDIYISASIGIALSNPKYSLPADYLRDTDTAMYRAKSLGKARYQVFDSTMHTHAIASLQMETELRTAVEKKEFMICYQPIFALKDKKIVRLEALIRWNHPRRGVVAPGEFISLAEETGLIFPIGSWVMTTVCEHIKKWRDRGKKVVPVAFNFSAKQFEQKDLILVLKEILQKTGIEGRLLGIEITESIAMRDVSLSISLLNELRALGLKISIDDFGIGYSSLSSLKLFPIDELKIDRSFIHDIIENPDKAAIAKAIIVMAHSLGYSVTGEGIENKPQLEFLAKNGCDEGQGHLFAKPMSFDDISEKLS